MPLVTSFQAQSTTSGNVASGDIVNCLPTMPVPSESAPLLDPRLSGSDEEMNPMPAIPSHDEMDGQPCQTAPGESLPAGELDKLPTDSGVASGDPPAVVSTHRHYRRNESTPKVCFILG